MLNGLGYLPDYVSLKRRTDLDLPDSENGQPVEHSSAGGWATSEGITVHVLIYRVPSVDLRWTLEIKDFEGGSTIWDETFDTAEDAFAAFVQTVKDEGIRWFTAPATRH